MTRKHRERRALPGMVAEVARILTDAHRTLREVESRTCDSMAAQDARTARGAINVARDELANLALHVEPDFPAAPAETGRAP